MDLGGIPRGMLRAAYYAPFAIRHHWTPEQVDSIPADVLPHFLEVENMLQEKINKLTEDKARE